MKGRIGNPTQINPKGEFKMKRPYPLIVAGLILSLLLAGCTVTMTDATPSYAEDLFGEEIISLDILVDQTAWQEMLDTAIEENYIKVDIVVNGTTFKDVGIRPKGNSSLNQVASSDSDRFSFRIKFDEYVEGQTCFGLDDLVVNNMMSDASYMKEYLSYDMMRTLGVDAPYTGFADVSVNGEAWGFYLAVELYRDSYETRIFGDEDGMLYNVKMTNGGKNNDQPLPEANTAPRQDRGGMIGGSSGGSLIYTDDDPSSYADIFENVVGDRDETSETRVMDALEALNDGSSLESVLDVDAALRYLAAHTFVVSLDSYSSNMAQNFYLYERDGQLTVLPWDYNQSFGGFQSSDAASVINFPIDTPVSNVDMAQRPLIDRLLSDETYLETYHGYLQALLDAYFSDGQFADLVHSLDELIASHVADDPSAFISYEEYEAAVDALIQLGELRAISVQGQLDGTVPSTTESQEALPSALIDSSGLDMAVLGSMGGGKERGDDRLDFKAPDRGLMDEALEILQSSGGELTEQVRQQLTDLGLDEAMIDRLAGMDPLQRP